MNLSRVLRHNPAHGQLSVNMVEIIRQYAKVVVTSAEESEMEESQELAELVMDRFDAAEVGRSSSTSSQPGILLTSTNRI